MIETSKCREGVEIGEFSFYRLRTRSYSGPLDGDRIAVPNASYTRGDMGPPSSDNGAALGTPRPTPQRRLSPFQFQPKTGPTLFGVSDRLYAS